jgi:hypothetical protein
MHATNDASVERTLQEGQPLSLDQRTSLPRSPEAYWCAAYVMARHEKVVADQLTRRSVEAFLPLYRSVRYWKNRRAIVELPLFPSDLFVRISGADVYAPSKSLVSSTS